MPQNRFYLASTLKLGNQYSLEGEEAQHCKVMRCQENDIVEVINGRGVITKAAILRIDKKAVHFKVIEYEEFPPPYCTFSLAQAIPRLNRLDAIIEKGTELGANQFLIFPGELSEKKVLTSTQVQRIEHIVIAATKQCGRLWAPSIQMMPSLKKWPPQEAALFFGDIAPSAPLLKDKIHDLLVHTNLTFFIGPEQGFSKNEEVLFSNMGAVGVRLHSNVLRTDTAAIATLSIASHLLNS
ncbi:MAG: RsmE family RNA methyltransferase [Parachlamydiaceae bacterium]